MSDELGRNGLSLCPKCNGETVGDIDLKEPIGFCSSCQWFTHSFHEEHNEMLLQLTGALSQLKGLTISMDEDVKAKRNWRKATHDIADNLLLKLGVDSKIADRKFK